VSSSESPPRRAKFRRRLLRWKSASAAPQAQPSMLELARFAAAMQELFNARAEFDRVMAHSPSQ